MTIVGTARPLQVIPLKGMKTAKMKKMIMMIWRRRK